MDTDTDVPVSMRTAMDLLGMMVTVTIMMPPFIRGSGTPGDGVDQDRDSEDASVNSNRTDQALPSALVITEIMPNPELSP